MYWGGLEKRGRYGCLSVPDDRWDGEDIGFVGLIEFIGFIELRRRFTPSV